MLDLRTRAVHAGAVVAPGNQPTAAPLYECAGWSFASLSEVEAVQQGEVPGAVYGGLGGPNQDALERLVAGLEGSPAAICTNGGMAAIDGCLRHLLAPGDRVVAGRHLFGPTHRLLTVDLARWGVACDLVDATDLGAVDRALDHRDVAVLYVETISNPRLRVVDIAALAELARSRDVRLVVDNTFASPAISRPVELGADVVVESLTKYVSGHADCVIGALAGPVEVVEPMRSGMVRAGALPSPFDAWLCVRGAQTFPLRFAAASRSAARIASWLEGEPGIASVLYPGLASHPDHDVAARMLGRTFGGVLSIELAGGHAAVERFVQSLHVVRLATSLGGVATTIDHSATMSHRSLDEDEQRRAGIGDGLVRLGVGIECVDDLIADLATGLVAAALAGTR
jgi:cystathionine beta-lyase/cystathionine gamma-synthase